MVKYIVMSEKDVIEKSSRPQTLETLKRDLEKIGVQKGTTLLVHSSMSSIGWICGGVVTLILALEEAAPSNSPWAYPRSPVSFAFC